MSDIKTLQEIEDLDKSLDRVATNLEYLRKKLYRHRWIQPDKYIKKKQDIQNEIIIHIVDLVETNNLKDLLIRKLDCL